MLRLALFAALAALAFASDVVILNKDNFDSVLKTKDIALVEFFAPWCGHCKRLAPEYEKAATALAAADSSITLATVDATEESELASKFKVTGYPTLKIFRNGVESADYQGPREADGITKYMLKQAGPSSRELKSKSDLDKFFSDEAHSVVGFFSSKESGMAKAFLKAADENRDFFRFAHTTDSSLVAEHGTDVVVVFQPPKLHSKFEDKTSVYDGKAKQDLIKAHVVDAVIGKAGVMTTDLRQFFVKQQPLLVVYYDLDLALNPSRAKYIRNRVLKVVTETKSSLTVAVASKTEFPSDTQSFGLDSYDVAVAIHAADGKKYRMDEEWSLNAMKQFILDFEDGKLETYVKSEPVQEDDGHVKVAVGKNIDDIINEPGKDVFIEAYAPWCGHCKSLAPKWSELAEKLKDEDSVTIAKVDATANDIPASLPVRGYPSLFWIPAGSKTPKKYEGAREVKDLLAYVKENASNLSKKSKDEL